MNKIDCLLIQFPLYSEDLRIDLTKPNGRFKWFLASILFGMRISEKIASNTFKAFQEAGIDSPNKVLSAGWTRLVEIIDSGGYVRYDFSTASKLLSIMEKMKERYGSLENLYLQSSNTKDLEKRLMDFKGIGPITVNIFLRELRGFWDVTPEVSSKTKKIADCLGIDLSNFKGERLSRIETALVKLNIRYCKKKRCFSCPLSNFCIKCQ